MSLRKEYIISFSKAMQGKLKESPVEDPRTRVEPAIMVVVCSTETEQLRLLSDLQTVYYSEGRASKCLGGEERVDKSDWVCKLLNLAEITKIYQLTVI